MNIQGRWKIRKSITMNIQGRRRKVIRQKLDAKKSNDGINYKTNRNRLFKECIPLAFFVTIAEYHTDATTRNDHNTNAKHPGKKKKSNDRNSNNANVKNRLF